MLSQINLFDESSECTPNHKIDTILVKPPVWSHPDCEMGIIKIGKNNLYITLYSFNDALLLY
jgi:hypothetical protein